MTATGVAGSPARVSGMRKLTQAQADAEHAGRSHQERQEATFLAGLEAGCIRLSEADAGHDDLRASSADQLLQPARDLGQALEDAATAAAGSATEAAVADQELEVRGAVPEVHQQVAGLLCGPRAIWMGGDPEGMNEARASFGDEQALGAAASARSPRGNRRRA